MRKLLPMAATTTTTTTTIEDLHPDLFVAVLRRLDGADLASTSCTTTRLRSVSGDPSLWRRLCFSAFPSVSDDMLNSLYPSSCNSHRSFFSLAFPFPSLDHHTSSEQNRVLPSRLISAVDVFHGESLVFSRVIETDTSSSWFHGSPFRIDAMERKEEDDDDGVKNFTCSIRPAELTLNWVIIDPVNKQVVNISSRRPVAVEKHWYAGDTLLKFGLTVAGRACCINSVVTCSKGGQVKGVSLTVEDLEGVCKSGRDCLYVVGDLMESCRRGRDIEQGIKEARRRYEEFVKMKKEQKERKEKMDGRLNMLCTSVGLSIFFTFVSLLLL